MLDFNPLITFSHQYCVAICAVLVPFNLLLTLLTLVLVGLECPRLRVKQSTAVAIGGAVLMVLHVFTWLVVGIIQIQTFILLSLGLVCLWLNLWALVYPGSLRATIRFCIDLAQQFVRSMVQRVEAS
jgi:hypothetical protein